MKITVAIPVGPEPKHRRYLRECLESVRAQTRPADEVVIVDDMAGLVAADVEPLGLGVVDLVLLGGGNRYEFSRETEAEARDFIRGVPRAALHLEYAGRVWRAPWRLGVAAAFNAAIGLARNEWVFTLGADDELEPDCLERVAAGVERVDEELRARCYFFVGVRYMDDREDPEQFLPCAAALVSKSLWARTGGFPPETASGASDAAFASMFWNRPDICQLTGLSEGRTLYRYRPHAESDTAERTAWQGIILATRDLLTATWGPPQWGRYE